MRMRIQTLGKADYNMRIVYLIHPTEFLASENHGVPASWFLSPRMWRVQGNPVRYFLFRKDGKVLFEEHKELFAYMKTFKWIKDKVYDCGWIYKNMKVMYRGRKRLS